MRTYSPLHRLVLSILVLLPMKEGAGQDSALPEPDHYSIFEAKSAQYGEWGQLEYSRLILEPPDHYIRLLDSVTEPEPETIWQLDAQNNGEVREILAGVGMSADLASRLAETALRDEETGWFRISPGDELILNMTPRQRAALYPQLMPQIPASPFFQPFALPPDGIQEVLQIPTGVSEKNLERISRLTYSIGHAKRFSDVQLLFRQTSEEKERVRILKVLGRESSLSAKIVLSDARSLSNLEFYWGSGGRNREILPILRSVLRAPGVERLDITHLLPPTPRKLLHTYPSPSGYGIAGDLPDCFWTAFSFFANDPPERHLDFTNHVFLQRYEMANAPFRFGDLILITKKSDNTWIHACNYIAEQLVFTKNGKSMGRPWVIAHLPRVIESYTREDDVAVSFFRLKPGYPQ